MRVVAKREQPPFSWPKARKEAETADSNRVPMKEEPLEQVCSSPHGDLADYELVEIGGLHGHVTGDAFDSTGSAATSQDEIGDLGIEPCSLASLMAAEDQRSAASWQDATATGNVPQQQQQQQAMMPQQLITLVQGPSEAAQQQQCQYQVEQPSTSYTISQKRSLPEQHGQEQPQRHKKRRKGKYLLWQFLLYDLLQGHSSVSWLDDQAGNPGVFVFKDSNQAARRWGQYKENDNMSYEKMSRCIRDYWIRTDNRYYQVMLADPRTERRRLHFAFNLEHAEVQKFIKGHSTEYYERLQADGLLRSCQSNLDGASSR